MLKQALIMSICTLGLFGCAKEEAQTSKTTAPGQVVEAVKAVTEVNVYSARKEELILPVLDRFTEKTGIKVNLLTGNADALITRIASEGELGAADVLITTDVGRLVRAKSQGLTQAVDSEVLNQYIPENLRDPENHWFGLTKRARPIMYSVANVKPEQLNNLEDLAGEQWLGKICIRSSGNIYNQSLIAAMLAQVGEESTAAFAKGLVANFARDPKGGDRDQIKAVAAGQCDIAVANTYYLAGMLTSSDESQVTAAQKVKVFWPNQSNRGAHVNISGAVMTKHSPNPTAAIALLEFMLDEESQAWYAEHNHEYPVRIGVEQSEILQSFGSFKAETIGLEKAGELNAQALILMDKAGWK